MKFQPSLGDMVRLVLIALPAVAGAQTEQPTPAPDPLAGIAVQVLDQQRVDLGDHTVTLNRIVPPPLPTPTPVSVNPAPPPVTPDIEKPCKVVSVSVDTQNQLFTEVRGYSATKPELHARLNIDLRLLSGISQIDTSDASYMYVLAFAFDSADTEANANPPDPTASLPEHASCVLTAGNAADYADVLSGLDALCTYFDSNRTQLVADYRKRRDEAEILRNQPPTPTPLPRDTVINFWPVKSGVYSTPH